MKDHSDELSSMIRHACYRNKKKLWSAQEILKYVLKDETMSKKYTPETINLRIHNIPHHWYGGRKVAEPVDVARVVMPSRGIHAREPQEDTYSPYDYVQYRSKGGKPTFFYKASDFIQETLPMKNLFIEQVLGEIMDFDAVKKMMTVYGSQTALEIKKVAADGGHKICALYEPRNVDGEFAFNVKKMR